MNIPGGSLTQYYIDYRVTWRLAVTSDTQRPQYRDVLGVSLHERQRLLTQAKNLEPEARWLMDQINMPPGQRVTDVGCGPIGVLDLRGERVGPDGKVIGLDLEPRFVSMAKQIVAQRGLTSVHIDILSAYCEPAHLAWDTLFDVFQSFVGGHGPDLRRARHLPTLFRGGGFTNVEAEVHARLARDGEPRRLNLGTHPMHEPYLVGSGTRPKRSLSAAQ